MKTKIFKRRLFIRVIIFIIIANFIFTSVPLGVYASWGEADKLRTQSRVMMDGGDKIELDLLIEGYKNKVVDLQLNGMLKVMNLAQIIEFGPVFTEGSTPLIDLVNNLTPQNINKDYLLKIISTAIEKINSNAQLPKYNQMEDLTVAPSQEALLVDLGTEAIKETFGFINELNKLKLGLRFRFESHEISKIENSVKLPENIEPRGKLLSLLDSFKKSQEQLSLADGGQVIPGKQEILGNLRNPVPGTIFYAVISDRQSDTDTVVSAIAEAYKIKKEAELEGKNIIAFPVIQGEINDETKYALDLVGINPTDLIFWEEVEDLLVALEKKNAILQIRLTDHSSIPGKQENLALLKEKLDWAIDHHPITNIKPEKTVYAEVGSTSTLIYERFRGSEIEIPKNLALLMLSAVLSDTKNLKVNTDNRDREAVEKLKQILGYSDQDTKELFAAQTCALNTINVPEPLKKVFSSDNLRYFPVPPLPPRFSFTTLRLMPTDENLFKKLWPEILEYITTDTQKRNLEVALFNLTHLNEEGGLDEAKLEEFFVIGPEYNALEYIKASQVPYEGGIEEIETPYKDISVYRLNHKGGAARKATVARISEYFEYIQAEDTVHTASGGKILKEHFIDNLQVKVDGVARLAYDDKPRLLIVAPNLFLGGIKSLLTEVAKLGKGIRIAAYEVNAKNLAALIGVREEDIISAEKLDDILEKLPNMGIEGANTIVLRTTEDTVDEVKLNGRGIRQIVVGPGMAPMGLAKAIKELLGDTFAKSVFTEFFEKMVAAEVISPVSKDIQQKILEDLKEGTFIFPKELTPTPQVIETIKKATDTEAYKKFVEKFIQSKL